jgi:hypothetical protein
MAEGKKPAHGNRDAKIPVYVFGKSDSIQQRPDGKFDVTLVLGQNRAKAHPVMVKITIQGKPVDVVSVGEKTEVVCKGLELDLSKPVEVKVEKAGEPQNNDRTELTVPADLKPSSKTDKSGGKSGIDFEPFAALNPDADGNFLVRFNATKDGKPAVHGFVVTASQHLTIVQGDETKEGTMLRFETAADGTCCLKIGFPGTECTITIKPDGLPEMTRKLTR